MTTRYTVPVLLLTGVALIAAALLMTLAAPAAAQDDPPLEPRGDVLLDYMLHDNPYTGWGTWPLDDVNSVDYGGFLPSTAPHGTAVRIFVNDIALDAAADPAFNGTLPPGSIIVKENYGVTPENPAVFVALTAMVKLDGFYPRGGDWFWLQASPGAASGSDAMHIDAAGAVRSCLDCHAKSRSDYLLAYVLPGVGPVSSTASPDAAGGLDGNAVIAARCTACHSGTVVDSAALDAAGWEQVLARHAGMGVALSDEEYTALLGTLTGIAVNAVDSAAPPPASSSALPAGADGNAIIEARCTVCHSRAVVDSRSYDAAGWERVLSWHSVSLTAGERAALIAYLSNRPASSTTGTPAAPVSTCTSCHTPHLINGSPPTVACTTCHTPHPAGGPAEDSDHGDHDDGDDDHDDDHGEHDEDDD